MKAEGLSKPTAPSLYLGLELGMSAPPVGPPSNPLYQPGPPGDTPPPPPGWLL